MFVQIMKLDNPSNMLNLILWIISLGILFYYSMYILVKYVKYRKQYSKIQKENIITWFLFFFLICTVTFDSILWRFIIAEANLMLQLSRFAIFLIFIAVIIKTINVERGINRSGLYKGYYFTPICIVTLGLSFIFTYNSLDWLLPIVMILVYIGWSLIPLVFFYLSIKTVGTARKDSLKIALGSLINLLGMLLQSTNENPTSGINIDILLSGLANYEYISMLLMMLYPIVSIIGMTLIYFGVKSSFNVI